MELILLEDVRELGKRGQVVRVKPGFGRNFLLPQGKALPATAGNRAFFEQQRKKIDARHTREREAAAEIAAQLAAIKVTIPKRVSDKDTLYGSVSVLEIVAALAKKGIEVDKRRVDVGGGIKTAGEHKVTIDLHTEVVAEVTVEVVPEE
ncbi:MAG: 50S ribosomal protein L9 [Thermoanaerobaculia bacterium]|nr:50S ribosomal protein L9 [Thermoanaerobaculia bacterium]